MLFTISLIVIFIIAFIIGRLDDDFDTGLQTFLFGFVILVIISFAIQINEYRKESQLPYYNKYELISVDHVVEDNITGGAFLVAYTIDKNEELYYRFYIKDEKGGIKLKEVKCIKITIYEDVSGNETPYYVETNNGNGLLQFHIFENSIIKRIDVDVLN